MAEKGLIWKRCGDICTYGTHSMVSKTHILKPFLQNALATTVSFIINLLLYGRFQTLKMMEDKDTNI
jgi:hypothetical protein